MSRDIGTFKGKEELVVKGASSKVRYQNKEMHLTVFYGGIKRGRSLQISIGYEHIQLDNKTAKELAKLLSDWENAPEVD